MSYDLYDDGNNYNMCKNKVPPPSDKYGQRTLFPGTNPGVQYHSALYNGINHNVKPYKYWGVHMVKKPDDDSTQYAHRQAYTPEKVGIKWIHPQKQMPFYNQS